MTTIQLTISIIKQLLLLAQQLIRAVRNILHLCVPMARVIVLVGGSIHFAFCVLFTIFFSAVGINPLSQYWEMFDSPPVYSLIVMALTMFAWFIAIAEEDMRPLG